MAGLGLAIPEDECMVLLEVCSYPMDITISLKEYIGRSSRLEAWRGS